MNLNSKITKSTLKSFIRKNADNLYIKCEKDFNHMIETVETINSNFKKIKIELESLNEKFYFVGKFFGGSQSDCFESYDDGTFVGIEMSNCCGSSIIAIKK